MKTIYNIIILICFFLFSYSCTWFNKSTYEIEKIYYDDGSIESVVSKKNGKLNGPSNYYDNNTNLISTAHYMNDLLHGVWIEYFPNGNIKHQVFYNYGLKHNSEMWYYKNGKIKSETVYDNGAVISETLRWDYDGNIIIK